MQWLVVRGEGRNEYVNRDGSTTTVADDAELMSEADARRLAAQHGAVAVSESRAFGDDDEGDCDY